MENPTRQFVVERLSEIFGVSQDDDLCTDLEKCMVRYAKRRIEEGGGEAAWDNHKFTNIYKHKFLAIKSSIIENPNL